MLQRLTLLTHSKKINFCNTVWDLHIKEKQDQDRTTASLILLQKYRLRVLLQKTLHVVQINNVNPVSITHTFHHCSVSLVPCCLHAQDNYCLSYFPLYSQWMQTTILSLILLLLSYHLSSSCFILVQAVLR